MAENRNEELLEAILNAGTVDEVPQSRMEKIWQYALGATVELDIPQSRLESLAILVAEQVRNGGGGITPTGTINITQNGTYDVTEYESAVVKTPQPTGTININTNGFHNVKNYSQALVSVNSGIIPSGTYYVDSNGIYNISHYESVEVNVAASEEDHTIEDGLIEGTLTGDYKNSRITKVHPYSFCSLYDISYIELPSVEYIDTGAFMGCESLKTLNLYSPDRIYIPTMSYSDALDDTAIARYEGYIVINDELVFDLKNATYWSNYAGQIIGHSDAIAQGIISA